MGKNNRARRAAKAKARQRAGAERGDLSGRRSGGWDQGEPLFSADELIAGLVEMAPARLAIGDESFAAGAAERLCEFPAAPVRAAVAGELRRAVAAMWNGGWQPSELVRQVRRRATSPAVELMKAAIAADHQSRHASTLDPRWAAQLDALDLPTVTTGAPASWVGAWADAERLERRGELQTGFEVLAIMYQLPRLETLIAPPGVATSASRGARLERDGVDRALLDKVRALLTKAESSTYEAEAEAFTAKAHELMARHAIDAAMLHAGRENTDAPVTIRIAVDDPYADARSLLLQVVAHANRCRAVFHHSLSLSSIVGFATDVAAVEMLYTSLLVQAQTALSAAGRQAPPGSRPRSRSFRSAFLVAYANRIGQRLDEINDALVTEAEATSGRSVLPVLRDRASIVDEAVDELFGELTSSTVRAGWDQAGWASGKLAADQAQLNFGNLDDAAGHSVSDVA
jgi:hypothetical protein